ncbi:Maf family protein [Psychrobacter immobilis]|uniref:Maf family protein n=1 Tax=Psychrobacter immobilis TaxID=498 RepID=UPI00191927C4|nr:Maf family protein [Psychrobacter immobilis]
MDIILASGSPRRRELLERAQLDFSLLSVDIDETQYDNELPKDYIERMVATKADAAIQQLNDSIATNKDEFAEQLLILTSDTIGVLADGQTVLVKPTDREHAYSMWQQMSDNVHEVWTAVQASQVSLLPKDTNTANHKHMFQVVNQQKITERTEVSFIPLTAEMMSEYWDSSEPADKAGGYGIQGLGAAWVSRINGSYTNVVGLPLAQTLALIKEMREMGAEPINSPKIDG